MCLSAAARNTHEDPEKTNKKSFISLSGSPYCNYLYSAGFAVHIGRSYSVLQEKLKSRKIVHRPPRSRHNSSASEKFDLASSGQLNLNRDGCWKAATWESLRSLHNSSGVVAITRWEKPPDSEQILGCTLLHSIKISFTSSSVQSNRGDTDVERINDSPGRKRTPQMPRSIYQLCISRGRKTSKFPISRLI